MTGRIWRTGVLMSAVVATAVTVRFGAGLTSSAAVTWWAPLPMLLAGSVLRPRRAVPAAAVGWAAGLSGLWSYGVNEIGAPAVVVAGFLAAQAVGFAAVVALFGALVRRRRWGWALASAPAAAVAGEYLQSVVSPHGALLALSVTQADVAPLVAVAAAVGAWGITALLFAVPASLAVLVLRVATAGPGRRRRAAVLGVSGAAAVALTGMAVGVAGAVAVPASVDRPLRVAGVAAAEPRDVPELSTPLGRAVLEAQLSGVREAVAAGADVVVLAEAAVVVDDTGLAAVGARLREAGGPSSVVLGVRHRHRDATVTNEAILLAPGGPDRVYRKQHPIPGVEAGVLPGDAPVVVPLGRRTAGLSVCKDLDFPSAVRPYAGTADVLLVPGWDFGVDGWYHSRIAVLRGAELGLPMVRVAREGRITVTDARGVVVREAVAEPTRTTLLVADLRTGPRRTLAAEVGDGLAWGCLAVTVLATAIALAGRRLGPAS